MKVRVYTDGACSENPGPGGWGVVFSEENKVITCSGHEKLTTNNRMELMAVVEAMKNIVRNEKEKHKNAEYELYSDSAYVVNSINSRWVENWRMNGWKTTRGEDIKNKDLWLKFLELRGKMVSENISLMILKVKGHSGDTFNEYADKIAKKEVLLARKGDKE